MYICVYIHVYIYIYIHTYWCVTANLRTKILDFRGFDSSIILIIRGWILMSTGNFPESLSQAILVGIILVGRLGALVRYTMQGNIHMRNLLGWLRLGWLKYIKLY